VRALKFMNNSFYVVLNGGFIFGIMNVWIYRPVLHVSDHIGLDL